MPKKITIELEDSQHRRFVNAKLDRGLRSLQELMIQATEAQLNAEVPGAINQPQLTPSTPVPHSPEGIAAKVRVRYGNEITSGDEREWVSRLLEVLRSGHAVAIAAIQSNLVAFQELVHGSANLRDPEELHAEPKVDAAIDRTITTAREVKQRAKGTGRGRGSDLRGEGRDAGATGTGAKKS